MNLERVAPILQVRDIVSALARYKQIGFEGMTYEELNEDGHPFYGFLWRGDVPFHLQLAPDLDPHQNTSAVYLYVDDPDALFAEWQAASPGGELRPPVNTPWQMREMSYSDPGGNLLRIGRPLASAAPAVSGER